MQDPFSEVLQLAIDPFYDEDTADALRSAMKLAESLPEPVGGGPWASCETCCDPGSDGYPAPGP